MALLSGSRGVFMFVRPAEAVACSGGNAGLPGILFQRQVAFRQDFIVPPGVIPLYPVFERSLTSAENFYSFFCASVSLLSCSISAGVLSKGGFWPGPGSSLKSTVDSSPLSGRIVSLQAGLNPCLRKGDLARDRAALCRRSRRHHQKQPRDKCNRYNEFEGPGSHAASGLKQSISLDVE